jgi:hypothetical protein
MAGKYLRVQLRQNDRTIETAFRRPLLRVGLRDSTRMEVELLLPQRLDPSVNHLNGFVEARYPWAPPLGRLSLNTRTDALGLPTSDPVRLLVAAPAQLKRGRLAEKTGRGALVVPLAPFELPDGPRAVSIGVSVVGPDYRMRDVTQRILLSDEPVHVWLHGETAEFRTGQPARFRVGWFDPLFLSAGAWPTLEVFRAGQRIIELPLWPGAGDLRSGEWIPTAPGDYEARATLPDSGVSPARMPFVVQADRDSAWSASVSEIESADGDGRRVIRVRISGNRPAPALLLAHDGEPRGAAWVPPGDADHAIDLALRGRPKADMRVVLLRSAGAGLDLLDGRLTPPPASAPRALTLAPIPDAAAPHDVRRFQIRSGDGVSLRGVTMICRLVDTNQPGPLIWRGAPVEQAPSDEIGLPFATSDMRQDAAGPSESVIRGAESFSASTANALLAGNAVWTEVLLAGDDGARLDVPLPVAGGRYRMHVLAHSPEGWSAATSTLIDDRGPMELDVESPESFSLGDRTFFSIQLRNRGSAPVAGTLRVDTGRGLALDKMRQAVARGKPVWAPDGDQHRVTMPARSSIVLAVQCEAAQVGRAAAEVEFQHNGRRLHRSVFYRVAHPPGAAPVDSAGPIIDVKRSVHCVDESDRGEPEEPVSVSPAAIRKETRKADAPRVALASGESIAPGKLLVIVDEFALPSSTGPIVWAQRAPGNCVTLGGELEEWRSVAPLADRTLQEVTFRGSPAPVGRFNQECVIVPVRSGSCELPPPQLRIDGKPVRLRVTPDEFRIVVPE